MRAMRRVTHSNLRMEPANKLASPETLSRIREPMMTWPGYPKPEIPHLSGRYTKMANLFKKYLKRRKRAYLKKDCLRSSGEEQTLLNGSVESSKVSGDDKFT